MNSSENKLPTFPICLKSPAHCLDSISRLPEIVLHKLTRVTHDIFAISAASALDANNHAVTGSSASISSGNFPSAASGSVSGLASTQSD